ncbi:N-acetylglucosamine kinase [Kitasatospora sp. Root107]|uniref:N-acetylglucosamine kinase n=1 Tax=Kitasatospora sp. Root107 TaxID=1736424 RepID=UPI000B0809E7|nr:BadF/BadG/BcrA/BcrD ATPase family protein [Kitasatospora sp. Root107]
MITGPLVLGLDVGGSTTRVLLADLDGRVLATATGAGGNPVSHGAATSARNVLDALRTALAEVDPARVTAGVIGLAGGLIAATSLDEVWPTAGLLVTPRMVSDLELAYTAGTAGPAGSVLLSGTGAAAAQCHDFEPVRTADGHGWLLGDRGSGYWLGRAAVASALAANDRGELDGLAAQVIHALAGPHPPGPRVRSALITAAHADAPVRLARLAPLVLDAATAGDPQARRLVERAADHLLDSLTTVRPAHSQLPVVLAGGVLSPDSPLTAEVRTRVAARWPDAPVTHAGNTAGAAAWLATRRLGHADGALHSLLTR